MQLSGKENLRSQRTAKNKYFFILAPPYILTGVRMSVDFEFRNKKRMRSYAGTPSYSALKKLFESGRIHGTKVVSLPKENRAYQVPAFSLDCGEDCWLQFYDTGKHPTIKMSHFDHMERAVAVLERVAALFDCVVLNDLDHGDSEVWRGKPVKKPVKKSTFGIVIKPINISFGINPVKLRK